MDKKELTVKLAAVISTLGDFPDGAPESILYLGIGCDLSEWYFLKGTMVQSDIIHEEYNLVTLTAKGKMLADKINAATKVAHA
jgi:hypothetical protein